MDRLPFFRFPSRAVLAAVLAAAVAAPPSARAEMEVITRQAYYDIHGDTVADLRHTMKRECTRRVSSTDCWAHTDWKVKWRYKYRKTDGRCALGTVRVTAEIVYTLPRWVDSEQAPADLRAKWETMIERLTKHENRHGEHGLAAARKIEETLQAMAPEADCKAMGRAANAAANRIIDAANQLDDRYDDRTDHGRDEGVTLR